MPLSSFKQFFPTFPGGQYPANLLFIFYRKVKTETSYTKLFQFFGGSGQIKRLLVIIYSITKWADIDNRKTSFFFIF